MKEMNETFNECYICLVFSNLEQDLHDTFYLLSRQIFVTSPLRDKIGSVGRSGTQYGIRQYKDVTLH